MLSENRVKFYVMQVFSHRMTIKQVPSDYRERVQEALDNGEYTPGHVMDGDQNV